MIYEILRALNYKPDDIVKKKHGSVPEIRAESFFAAVLEHETIPKIAQHFQVSVQTINRLFAKLFPDEQCQGRQTWRMLILDKAELKRCITCTKVRSKTEFYRDNRSLTGTMSICKRCDDAKGRFREIPSGTGADLEQIVQIYTDCPVGYHVDHIIPISRDGLHHQDNLCYLPAKLNIAKGNKLPDEVPEIMAHAIYP
jgi:hypothetical protein